MSEKKNTGYLVMQRVAAALDHWDLDARRKPVRNWQAFLPVIMQDKKRIDHDGSISLTARAWAVKGTA